jgi:VWFA-related protein
MPRTTFLACVWMAGLLTVLVSAQQAGEQPTQPPVFRTGTNVVRVDVSVLDREGHPVRTLTADDFEIRENGELQSISSFKLVDANGEPTDDLSLPIRSPEHAAVEAARDDVRVFLIFWDEYHIDQFASAVRAREQLMRFVLEAFGPTDLVGLMDQLTPVSALRFSRNRRALADEVHLLRGRRGVYVPARSAIEEAQLRSAQDVERIRSQVTVSALKSAIMHLGTIRQGRKAVVFVTEGLGRLGQDGVRVLSDLIRTANDNNTAIYTVDPRGLQASPGFGGGMSSLLAALADSTGAESIVSNDIATSLRQIVTTASAFYLLGYSPKGNELDGKFREIKVRVKQAGVQVRARNGYWAPRAAEIDRARAIAAAAALPSTVSLAFKELTPDNSRRPADFWIGMAPAGSGADLRIAWSPRNGIEGRSAASSVSVTATTAEGEKLFGGSVETGGTTFRAPAGSVKIDLTTRDGAGEVIDREERTLTVPSPDTTILALSTPVLCRARNNSEFRALVSNPQPPAFAGRDFSRNDRLMIRVVPFGSSSTDAEISAQLLGPRGTTLVELPIHPVASGAGYQIDLPLTSLASGEFLVAIVARSTTERVETLVPLRIGR